MRILVVILIPQHPSSPRHNHGSILIPDVKPKGSTGAEMNLSSRSRPGLGWWSDPRTSLNESGVQ